MEETFLRVRGEFLSPDNCLLTSFKKQKITLIYEAFPKTLLSRRNEELVIGMANEDYEMIDKLESIAKSLQSMAESQKRMADVLELLVQEKELIDLKP
ncbi:hypothetical protein ACSAZL_21275 [Methanosarcina sp. T3]|uniref:hypothetical protein n=1 Tax=Methanosarcina sp. T3 TaxID=3439062 RepID=UPI003F84F757